MFSEGIPLNYSMKSQKKLCLHNTKGLKTKRGSSVYWHGRRIEGWGGEELKIFNMIYVGNLIFTKHHKKDCSSFSTAATFNQKCHKPVAYSAYIVHNK